MSTHLSKIHANTSHVSRKRFVVFCKPLELKNDRHKIIIIRPNSKQRQTSPVKLWAYTWKVFMHR